MTAQETEIKDELFNNNQNEDVNSHKVRLKDPHKSSKKRQTQEILETTEITENNNICKPCTKHKTVNAEDVELVIREPYILTGYRLPNQPWSYYLYSACWIHNETGNIWTHLIGCVLLVVHAVVLGVRLDNFRDSQAGLMLAFAFTCFLSNLFSSVAHLLHSKTAKHHYILYFLDYAGICIYNFGNGIDALYSCGSPKQYFVVKSFFLAVLVFLCYMSFLAVLVARLKFQGPKYDRKRKLVMTVIYLLVFGFVAWPIFARYMRCFEDEDCSVSSLNHITVILVFYVLDGLSFPALLPEKLCPGKFDIWGHSHQWFHVFVVITQQLQLVALHVDYVQRGRGRHVTTPLSSLLITLGVLMMTQAVTVKLMVPSIEKKVAEGVRRVNSAGSQRKMMESVIDGDECDV